MTQRQIKLSANKESEKNGSVFDDNKALAKDNHSFHTSMGGHNMITYSFCNPFLSGAPPLLKINEPDDQHEEEANAMAENVNLMTVADDGAAGRHIHSTNGDDVPNISSGRVMDKATRAFMESRFNYDFRNVRIHDDDAAARSAQDMHARAYTFGNNIMFSKGTYEPNTSKGRKLLAHELTHVIQQSQVGAHLGGTSSNPRVRQRTNGFQIQRQVAPQTVYNITLVYPPNHRESHQGLSHADTLRVLRMFANRIHSHMVGGEEGHRYLQQIHDDQYIVSGVSDFFGGTSIPSLNIWNQPRQQLVNARRLLEQGEINAAVRELQQTAITTRNAEQQVNSYREGTISGAERAVFGLEVLQVAGSVAVSLIPGVGVIGAGAYTALQSTARQTSEIHAGLRDRIDWAGITFDTVFSMVTARMGSRLNDRIMARLVGNPAVASFGRRATSQVISDLIVGRATSVVHMAVRNIFDNLRGSRDALTYDQFIHHLALNLTDPRSAFMDILLGGIQRRAGRRIERSRAASTEASRSRASDPIAEQSVPDSRRIAGAAHEGSPVPTGPEAVPSTQAHSRDNVVPEPTAAASSAPVDHAPAQREPGYRPRPGERSETRSEYRQRRGRERWQNRLNEIVEGNIQQLESPHTMERPQVVHERGRPRLGSTPVPQSGIVRAGQPGQRGANRRVRLDMENLPRRGAETQRQALQRIRTFIGRTIADIPAMRDAWNAARAEVTASTPLTATNYQALYNRTRNLFWQRVRQNHALVQQLQAAGFSMPSSARRAPVLAGVHGDIPLAERQISLDHIAEKAQGDNWTRALDADNLQLTFSAPNSNREITQSRHPELRDGSQ